MITSDHMTFSHTLQLDSHFFSTFSTLPAFDHDDLLDYEVMRGRMTAAGKKLKGRIRISALHQILPRPTFPKIVAYASELCELANAAHPCR